MQKLFYKFYPGIPGFCLTVFASVVLAIDISPVFGLCMFLFFTLTTYYSVRFGHWFNQRQNKKDLEEFQQIYRRVAHPQPDLLDEISYRFDRL